MSNRLLLSAGASRLLDTEAQTEWGFNTFSLVESAGRTCARVLAEAFPDFCWGTRPGPRITVAAGSGNNGADAMVMLRCWILKGLIEASASVLIMSRLPGKDETSPAAELIKSLRKMKVPVLLWNGDAGETAGIATEDALAQSDIILDGIAGTGLNGPLHGAALEMVNAVNAKKNGASLFRKKPFVVSIDVPSGNSDEWEPGMPIIEANLTLAIEPQKYCLYTPVSRPYAGIILPVGGVFPEGIFAKYKGAELLDWQSARQKISKIRPDVHKNERGTVEIYAGSPGATGAALIAARGAQAAGAGLIRLAADDEIYPILASRTSGIMVRPLGKSGELDFNGRFKPDAVLLGPGWGTSPERIPLLEKAFTLEQSGVPIVLDADAIALSKDKVFNGNVILTPHPGEFSVYTGMDKNEFLCRPAPVLLEYARERRAIIMLKSHVITIAAPDGRLAVIDGMAPGLAGGGSGDLLAGFCAALAARMTRESRGVDLYDCACAAAALLIVSGKSKEIRNRFTDPMEIADMAANFAGEAWLDPVN